MSVAIVPHIVHSHHWIAVTVHHTITVHVDFLSHSVENIMVRLLYDKATMLWWATKDMLCSTRWTLDEQKWVYLSTMRKFRWLQRVLTNNQEITSTNSDSEMAILNKAANTRIFPLKVSIVTWTTTASSHILLNSYIINYVHKVSNL